MSARAPSSSPPGEDDGAGTTGLQGPAATEWLSVGVVIAVGILSSFQAGKVPIALNAIREDLSMGLVSGSALLAMFGAVGTAIVLVVGMIARARGVYAVTLTGVLLAAAGNLAGAAAPSEIALFATRLVEGVGFIAIMVTGPALLVGVTALRDRWLAFGVLGSVMPLGTTIVIVLAPPVLAHGGWRAVWAINGALLLLGALAFAWRIGRRSAASRSAANDYVGRAGSVREVWRLRGPRLLALSFMVYSLHWVVFVGFLPTLYQARGIPLGQAGLYTGVAVLVNVAGNLAGGVLARRGVASWVVLAATPAVMGACAVGIFADSLAFWQTYALALVYSTVAGLLPATVLLTIPTLVRVRRDVPAASGIVMEGAQIGAGSGPLIAAALVSATGGWIAAGWVLAALAAVGVAVGIAVRGDATAAGA